MPPPNTIASEIDTYDRISDAITFIRQHHLEQPNLSTIAQHVNLSDYHFQRLFTQWAGISPKRFLQYLTLDYAKSRIDQSQNLLALTAESGLSSPGRLHDLFITLEAMSPGEYRAGGAGLNIRYGIHETPFGYCLIALTPRGICNIHFLPSADEQASQKQLQTDWPQAKIIRDQTATGNVCDQVFAASPSSPLALHLKGTNFQIQVWQALLRIPQGELTTYQTLATAMGKPTAARAIGNAVGRNPIAYLIPCHRVIRRTGELGGYRWGCDRKAAMLGWEASQIKE
ncbi:methylated-DNA--[protein]-cysteine S-methyltransferase [Acaryochloris marina]|uniref:methylated-DNA--[protein]-cysteine S-methyltransferase n=1 Tax=Acaryochloris marina (strain MBIC 11017) TaxID=329726 RepID=B0C5U7_ACAM1|nr:methylated-DNA--[protein]-cysteine S-methyltransferase [Acaryochloris marina]ABW29959.1 methylated DNA-protein cysteine methyltransferase [Acaryochloris marina MBIC11017]